MMCVCFLTRILIWIKNHFCSVLAPPKPLEILDTHWISALVWKLNMMKKETLRLSNSLNLSERLYDICKSGWMTKRSQNKKRFTPINYKLRWFELTKHFLCYFDVENVEVSFFFVFWFLIPVFIVFFVCFFFFFCNCHLSWSKFDLSTFHFLSF